MHKTYILDTSVLVHDYSAIEKFVDNNIVIPIAVLEELDHLKIRPDNVGTNARRAIRILEELCSKGDVQKGIDIGDNIIVSIDVVNVKSDKFNSGSKDDSILSCVLARKNSGENAVIVSKDINMRLRAKAYGIEAQDYQNDKVKNADELYAGHRVIELTDHIEGFSTASGLANIKGTVFEELYPNEYVEVSCNAQSHLFRRHPDNKLLPVRSKKVWDISSRSKEQAFLLDALLDPNVPLVTVSGMAGTGKSLLSVGAGLETVIEMKRYNSLKMFKPVTAIPGQDLGFLPGDMSEKIKPFMGSFYDALEVLFKGANVDNQLAAFKNTISFEPLTYIRGRSLSNSFLIFDETQNITKNDIKTIITRIGEGTKVVFCGDYHQIDVSYLDISNNGLTQLIESFKEYDLAAHVTLQKGERSKLSALAASIL